MRAVCSTPCGGWTRRSAPSFGVSRQVRRRVIRALKARIASRASRTHTYGDGVKLDYEEAFDRFVLHVQNIGSIKVKLHRFLPDSAKIKHVVIKRQASGW